MLHYGCKVNQYESNAMMQKFEESGYIIKEMNEKADIYIVNTCTVTNMADKKSRQMLRRMKKLNPNSIIVACGCYVQVSGNEVEKMEEIDLVLGNNEKNSIVEKVEDYIKNTNNKMYISDVLHKTEFEEFGKTIHTETTRAVIKVQDGCDRFCSYCIIPYARGHVRSRKIENIVEEIKEIAIRGIKEVIITGIHIASYGKDFKENVGLIDLLEEINKIEGIERIRLGSLEPKIIDEKFIQRLKEMKKICHHFHLSLQSGCDSILRRMNRRYTTKEFENVVKILRNTYEDVILTTDIIVGFPGETEQEFIETKKYLEKIKFYKMHVFPYSKRKGTKAANMENQIDEKTKAKRCRELIDLSNKNLQEYNKSYIGKIVKVLFEEEHGIYIEGHTDNYLCVKVEKKNNIQGKIKNVKIVECNGEEIIGELRVN